MNKNIDTRTVDGFGDEWTRFDQAELSDDELRRQFDGYFAVFPWSALSKEAVGFDMGCGSGRWAKLVAPKVGRLICCDASAAALEVARRNLAGLDNCELVRASFDNMPITDESMDFGYSLGVLHHIPDTAAGIRACVRKLKPGAPFLVYIYYAFDNRPAWFRLLWRLTDLPRRVISRLPFRLRHAVSQVLAVLVYFPLARTARLLERLGLDVDAFPLSAYRSRSFYSMRTDALDRFGTRLEKRFTRQEINEMMAEAGLERIQFSDSVPYWCAVGYRRPLG
jgi:SAM-dependent methyltransferase